MFNYLMDNKEIRRRNFWALVHPYGYSDDGVSRCAERTGLSEQRIRHLIKKSPDIPAKNIGDNAARDIENYYDKPAGWLDILHDEDAVAIEQQNNVAISSDQLTIIQHNDVSGSMGQGVILNDQPGQITGMNVTMEWAEKNIPANTGSRNLRIVTGFGDSMKGMFNSGDPLLIDIGVKSVKFDGVYFFRIGDEGFIKRLQRVPGSGIIVISNNPEYRDWTITPDMDFEVFGRVLKVWNGNDV